ncbi:MAG: hypothetical protein H3C46_01805 [Ignavibacteria bacterium]|nr:hypothetical protein [Ignavibacteria bacterium]
MLLKRYLKYTLILFTFFTIPALAQKYPDKNIHFLLERGINFMATAKYDSAKAVFGRLEKAYPRNPFGSLYLAATEIVKCYDWGVPYNESYIAQKLANAEKLADKNLDNNNKDVWNNYAMAMVYAFQSYYDYLREAWFGVFNSGTKALKYFDKCLSIDKKFYEASSAIAIFDYWKSVKTKDFSWLPFITDNSENDLKIIERNIKYPSYHNFLIGNSLGWIYIDKKQYSKALSLCDNLLKKAPGSRILRWTKARALEEIDRKKAIEVYKQILSTFPTSSNYYYYSIVMLKHRIAINYEKLKMYKEALKMCDEILAIKNFNSYDKKRLAERLKNVTTLRNSLKKKI